MRRRILLRAVFCLVGLLAGALVYLTEPAAASVGPFHAEVPVQTVPWTAPSEEAGTGLALRQFDPSQGTLVRAELTVTANLAGSAGAENLEPVAATLGLELAADVDVDTGDPLQPLHFHVVDDATVHLARYDGGRDFAGPSGHTVTGMSASETAVVAITDRAVLAKFIGTSTIVLPAAAVDLPDVFGDGNLSAQFDTAAGVTASVRYFYARVDIAAGPGATAVEGLADSQIVAPGADATFAVAVVNTGDVPLTDVAVTDALAPACARNLGGLAPGARVDYGCTAAGATAGYTNTASVQASAGTIPVADTDSSNVVVAVSSLAITNTPSASTVVRGGQVTFTITVTNTGGTALANVAVTDAARDGTPYPQCDRAIGALAPGASVSYGCTVTNIQSGFTNVASVTATAPGGAVSGGAVSNVTASHSAVAASAGPDGAVVPTQTAAAPVQVAALNVVKKVNGDDANTPPGVGVALGGALHFTYTVTNTGEVPLSHLNLDDDKFDENDLDQISCAQANLGPGESMECSATGVQLTMDVVRNTATVTGTTPTGETVTATDVAHHHGVAAGPCRSSGDAPAVEGLRFWLNGDVAHPVDDLRELQLHPGDVVTMSFRGASANAAGCEVSLAVYRAHAPVFDVMDDQQLLTSATCTPGSGTAPGGAGAPDCRAPDGNYTLSVTIPTGSDPFQVDAVTGAPLAIVGPSGGYYSSVLTGKDNRLISAQMGSGQSAGAGNGPGSGVGANGTNAGSDG